MMSDNGIDQVTDFDAFFAEYSITAPRKKVKVRGEIITLPFDLPLELEQKMSSASSSNKEELAALLSAIYGEDVLDKWIEKKMGVKEMAVLISWTLMRVQGSNMSLLEVTQAMESMVDSGKLKTLLENTGGQ